MLSHSLHSPTESIRPVFKVMIDGSLESAQRGLTWGV